MTDSHRLSEGISGGTLDGVPGAKTAGVSAIVSELEGTTQREARAAWGERERIPWLADLPESAD